MKKKVLSILLAVLLLASVLPMSAWAAETATSGDCSEAGDGSVTWKVEGSTLRLSGSGKIKEEYNGGYMAPWKDLHPTKAVISADFTNTDMPPAMFWFDDKLESFEVEEGNSVYFAYDNCLYANCPVYTYEYEYDPEVDMEVMVPKPTGETEISLMAIPMAKKGPLVIREGTVTGLSYGSNGLIGPCQYLTGIEFPSSWWAGENYGGDMEMSVFDDPATKMYRLGSNSGLEYFKIGEDHPNTRSIDGCLYTKDGKKLVWAPPMPANNELKIAEGTELIGYLSVAYAARYRESYTQAPLKVFIPRSVTAIDEGEEQALGTLTGKVEIHGYKGTLAETIAQNCNLMFVDLETGDVTRPAFTDVPDDAWFKKAVDWAVENKITSGTGDGSTFSPGKTCTRAEIVMFLWKQAGSPAVSADKSFADVPAGSWYEKAVNWAVANKVTSGKDASHFAPDATCTRAEAVMFLWNAAQKPAVSGGNSFTDVPANIWYGSAVNWAVANKITSGTGDGTTFSPEKTCTRAEIVMFLMKSDA